MKTRAGAANDDDEDLDLPYWTGVIPLRVVADEPITNDDCDLLIPAHVRTAPTFSAHLLEGQRGQLLVSGFSLRLTRRLVTGPRLSSSASRRLGEYCELLERAERSGSAVGVHTLQQLDPDEAGRDSPRQAAQVDQRQQRTIGEYSTQSLLDLDHPEVERICDGRADHLVATRTCQQLSQYCDVALGMLGDVHLAPDSEQLGEGSRIVEARRGTARPAARYWSGRPRRSGR